MIKTTGIGSLPHSTTKNAIDFSLKHSLPFLPQMTNMGERMQKQAIEYQNVLQNHQALMPFIEALKEKRITTFKIQIAGPSTCNTSSINILKTIDAFLILFEQYQLKPIVFIDEPILSFKSKDLFEVLKELKIKQIQSGIHCCQQFDWNYMNKLEAEFISFDTSVQTPSLSNSQLIYGIDPVKKNPLLNQFLNQAEVIVSYTCGLAKFNENECENIFEYFSGLK